MQLFSLLIFFFGVNFYEFDSYQEKLTYEEAKAKIVKFLEKDQKKNNFYKLTEEALYVGDLCSNQIDYTLYFSKMSRKQAGCPKKGGLGNKKIAIDPGHFGGDLARVEERYIDIPGEETKTGERITFSEGDLTLLTALELRRLLLAEGATVFLTRDGFGKGAIEEDFSDWKRLQSNSDDAAVLSKSFRADYNSRDLKERAKKINEFSPDITIIIHYNAHRTDEEKKRNSSLTETNFNLAFIPGAFKGEDLNTPTARWEFLRLLVTDDVEESLALSEAILKPLVCLLDVPVIPFDEKTSYIGSSCLFQKPGIYSRNLALTRLVHSPLCYGETLIQNNRDEVYRLSDKSATVSGAPGPQRVKQVAEGYFQGIKAYFSE